MVNTFVLHRQFASGSKQTQPQGSQADLLLVSVWSPGKWQGWGKRCIEDCAEPIAKSICCLLSKLCICHITNVSQVSFNHLLSTFKSAKGTGWEQTGIFTMTENSLHCGWYENHPDPSEHPKVGTPWISSQPAVPVLWQKAIVGIKLF